MMAILNDLDQSLAVVQSACVMVKNVLSKKKGKAWRNEYGSSRVTEALMHEATGYWNGGPDGSWPSKTVQTDPWSWSREPV
jgi:hypothetical protein